MLELLVESLRCPWEEWGKGTSREISSVRKETTMTLKREAKKRKHYSDVWAGCSEQVDSQPTDACGGRERGICQHMERHGSPNIRRIRENLYTSKIEANSSGSIPLPSSEIILTFSSYLGASLFVRHQ